MEDNRNFIDEEKIQRILDDNNNPSREKVLKIIEKARELKGLTPEETAALLQCKDNDILENVFEAARFVKESIYGKRLVLFAPLYLTNICTNNCLYCAFRRDNKELVRKQLNMEEIKKEVELLVDQGQKRLLVVAGEDPKTSSLEYVKKAIETIYEIKKGNGEIRRVNVNIAPMGVEDFEKLKKIGIGTYQIFQETYHKETYKEMHPSGLKANYDWRLSAMDRAMQAGIDDVGIGVLFGLYDFKFEVLALLYHAMHLEEKYGVGPHTISVPRIEPALNAPAANNIPAAVSNEDFKKLVAVLRLAVPYTGIILTTREAPPFRDEVFKVGISQISAGSRTNPGAYNEQGEHFPESEQFHLGDTRTLAQVTKDIGKEGFYPSFCTACYRLGRTGEDFMSFAKCGKIKDFCLPNCIMTFKEYLLDYADEEMKRIGEEIIKKEVEEISDELIKGKTKEKLSELEEGKRDLYF